MKKLLITIFTVTICALSSNVWAQPFATNMQNDVYGITQGGGNILGVPTPKDDNDSIPDNNDAINLLEQITGAGPGTYAHNSDVDSLRWTFGDVTWFEISDTGASATYTLIGLTAANSNTLQVYDVGDPGTKISVLGPTSGFGFAGNGSFANPFPAGVSPFIGANNFGWALKTEGGFGVRTWDSNPVNNTDGYDHMITYHLPQLAGKCLYISVNGGAAEEYCFYDPYLIAWEDDPYASGIVGDGDYDDMMFLVDRVAPVPEPMSMMLFGSGLVGLVGARLRRKSS